MERSYQYRPVLFYLATIVVSWIPWFIGVYLASRSQAETPLSLFNLIGLLGPLAVSLFLILTSGSRALKRDFTDRLLNWRRIRPAYLVAALVMPPIATYLSIGLSLGLGQSSDQFRFTEGGSLVAMIILAMVLAPVIEEVGWRGYGVDSLRAKMGMLKASLLFGVLWSLWHAPLVLIPGTYQNELARMENPLFLVNFFVSVVPVALVANWFYYRNNRSIVASILLHSMLNAAAILVGAGQVAKSIVTVVYTVVAVALIATDRAPFGEGPRDFLGEPSGGR